MPNFDKNRIFNESPKKVLYREFENLKADFSKLGAVRYQALYENAPLSFILKNSQVIFTEPYYGYGFYKNIMEHAILPFGALEQEMEKVDAYLQENANKMSDTQKANYMSLMESMRKRFYSIKNTSCLYDALMEGSNVDIYDDLYEFTKNPSETIPESIMELMESEDINLIDMITVGLEVPRLHSEMVMYLEQSYDSTPSTPEDYAMNTYTSNVIFRMMRDSYFSERVNALTNMNLRHFIQGLGGLKSSELIDQNVVEMVKDYNPGFSTTENSVNQIFEDDIYSELLEETNLEEKTNRLLCEKAILDMNIAFLSMDAFYEDVIFHKVNSIVEQICIESTTMEKIPQDLDGQIKLLEERSSQIDDELAPIMERYFSRDGTPGLVVSKSLGRYGQDKMTSKDAKNLEPEESKFYVPTKKLDTKNKDDDEPDDSDDESELEKRNAAKKRRDDKYSKMDINSPEFKNITEAVFKKKDNAKKEDKPEKVEKPEKRPFFQRVQNKALDTNVQFKKTVAAGRRKAQDARNAGKALAKIPMNISDSIKKAVDNWEELDDNRRKEYMIKPGNRKKVFRALKLAITHGIAWSINPLLNIVLAISHKLSAMKDERLKNELVRELKAEIRVTEEKIEDAKANGDNQQKYRLMRIKEKLDAELTRVGANAKFI